MTSRIVTKRLSGREKVDIESDVLPVDVSWDIARPWRIALTVTRLDVQLVFDIFEEVIIGREPETGAVPTVSLLPFVVENDGVSRRHVSISIRENRVYVTDLHSLNHTYLNGRLLAPDEPCPLQHGDMLVLGSLPLRVDFVHKPF